MDEGEKAAARRYWVALALIVAIGAALRIVNIDREALWTDEALTLAIARLPLWDLMTRPVDPTPGLFYALHHIFLPDPQSAGAARSIACLFGISGIGAAAWLGHVAGGRRGSLLLAALVALSFPLIDYSQEARTYSLLVAAVTASAAGLTGYLQDRRQRDLWLFALFGWVAAASHLVGWFWTGPATILLLLWPRPEAERRAVLGAVFVMILAASVPLSQIVRYGSSHQDAFHWLAQKSLRDLIILTQNLDLPFGLWAKIGNDGRKVVVAQFLIIAFLSLFAISWIKFRHRWRPRPVVFVAMIMACQPLLLWMFGLWLRPILMDRTALPGAIGFFLMLVLVDRLWRSQVIATALLGLYALSLVPLGTVRPKEDWRKAARAVAGPLDRTSMIVICPAFEADALQFAAREIGADGGPFLALFSGVVMLVEPQFGHDAHFMAHDVDRRLRRIVPAYAVEKQPAVVRTRLPTTPNMLAISGDCTPHERSLLDAWFGPARRELVWQSTPRTGTKPLLVERVFPQPRPREVVILPVPPAR